MTVSASAGPACSSAVEEGSPRRLAVAWQHPDRRSIQPVGLLSAMSDHYEFCYIQNASEVDGFTPFFGFPELHRRYASERLFPLFAQRVMDPRRPDYVKFVQTLDLSPEATPWEQLTRSEGRRSGDTIVLFPEPVVNQDGSSCCKFFVHGIRHMLSVDPDLERELSTLRQGDALRLVPDPDNPVNPKALLATDARNGIVLGWVPDVLLDYAHAVLNSGDYRLDVRRANGADVPTYQKLLVELDGFVAEGFSAFASERWRPLA
jgi:hypothetical protein